MLSRRSRADEPSRAIELLQKWRAYAILAVAVFVLFGPTLRFGYTGYDDDALIRNNLPFLTDLSRLPQAFVQSVLERPDQRLFFRPILTVSFMLDASIAGGRPWMFHLSNLLYHLVATWLLFALLNTLLPSRRTALLLAVGFAVHPLVVQAVSWIPGRNDLLLGIFVFAAFLAWEHWLRSGRMWYVVVHLLLFLAGLLTKETAVVVPLVAGLWWAGREKVRQEARRTLIVPMVGWTAVLALWIVLRHHALAAAASSGLPSLYGWREMALGLVSYAGKALLPWQLSMFPVPRDLPVASAIAAVVVLGALIVLWGIDCKKRAIFGLSWFVLFLFPTFVRSSIEINFLEPRAYVPLAGLALMLGELRVLRTPVLPQTWRAGILAVFLLFLAVRSWSYSQAFRDEQTFWQQAVQRSPHSAFVHYGLGNALSQNRDYRQAIRAYRRVVEILPTFGKAHYNLANAYLQVGDLTRAELAFRNAISHVSDPAPVFNNLGLLYEQRGLLAKADSAYRQALQHRPQWALPMNNLGTLFLKRGMSDSAIVYLEKAVALAPTQAEFHFNLANAYRDGGLFLKAVACYQRAIEQDASYLPAYNNLSALLAQMGKTHQAVAVLRKALEIAPTDATLHANLAILYASEKQYEAAAAHYRYAREHGVTMPSELKFLESLEKN